MKMRKLSAALLALLLCIQPAKAEGISRTAPVSVQGSAEVIQAAKAAVKTGWVHTENGYKYRNADGTWAKSTWKKIGGKYYYFGSNGIMRTGWLKLNGRKYYCAKSGARVSGWVMIRDRWYCFTDSGVMRTGWFSYKGKWFFCGDNGVMKTGWVQYKDRWFLLSEEGVMLTGWQKLNGKTYYLQSSGVMSTGWKKISGKWYSFSKNGAMRTGWQKISGKWYFFSGSGVMRTGWQKLNSKWYYFGSNGAMRTGWQQIKGKWYWFGDNGAMRTGWQSVNGKWYYLQSDGSMVTGSQTIGSKTQRFDANGVWQKEVVIPDIVADYAYVFDVTGNEVLYAKNENERMWPASLTKVMTVLLALENLNLSDTITVKQEMLNDLAGQGLSQAGFRAGQTLSYRDLLYGAMLPSGADACNIIAYAVSGSTGSFVDLMNSRARRLGMMNTHFVNVHGNDDPNHYSTARDIEILMEAAIKHDTFLNVISTYSYTTMAGQRLISSVLKKTSGYGGEYSIPGLVGGKTGYTPDARYNLAVLTNKDGRKRIFVVAHSWVNSYPTHFRDISLLAKAFNE
ncbi:MAG: serine hydrolase [Solobacterium sp.]|nr:serine hydrolase [Solobacterium sp.]